jgi:predicted component of type VI protein secretion system
LNNVIPASSPAPQRARLVIPAGRRTNRPFAIQPVAKRTIQTTGPTHAFAEDTNSRRVSQLSEALNESDASHELFVPSALANCDAPSGAASLRTIPLRRCSPALRPARPLRRWPASPLRFFAVTDAMRLCSMADMPAARVAMVCRHQGGTIRHSQRKSACHRSFARVSIGETDSYHARERPVTSSATASIRSSSRADHCLAMLS